MSISLYGIAESLRVLDSFEPGTDEEKEAYKKVMADLTGAVGEKINATCAYRSEVIAESSAIDTEIKRLQERKSRLDKKSESLKSYIEWFMLDTGNDKITTPMFTVAFQNNPPSVYIKDESKIPAICYKTVTTTTLSKTLVKEMIEAGSIESDIAEIIQTRSLRIK